jgi:two-component system LytT family response regulator
VTRVIRALVADDEPPARAKLRRFLEAEPDFALAGEAGSGTEAVAAVREMAPDVVFLDVQMPGMDGFGVVSALAAEDRLPHVVFVTAFDEHAVRAFEVRALDYLLKPFTPDRFSAVLDRVREQVRRGAGAAGERLRDLVGAPAPRYLSRLLVETGGRSVFLAVDRIDRVEAQRNYVRLHAGGATYLLRAGIGEMEARLDPAAFLRISRGDIVRIDAIREVHPWFHGDQRVVMADGTTLAWSRRFRAKQASAFGV